MGEAEPEVWDFYNPLSGSDEDDGGMGTHSLSQFWKQ